MKLSLPSIIIAKQYRSRDKNKLVNCTKGIVCWLKSLLFVDVGRTGCGGGGGGGGGTSNC